MFAVIKLTSGEALKDVDVVIRGAKSLEEAVAIWKEETELLKEDVTEDTEFYTSDALFETIFDRFDISIKIELVEVGPNRITAVAL